ncbi:MAG: hypothetical protein AB7P04_10840 [Bacteriovoracia bacterium]
MKSEVTTILRTKNRCLMRFLDWSIDFLKQADAGDLSGLEAFHEKREAILKALDLYDRKIGEIAVGLTPEDKDPIVIENVKMLLAQKEILVLQILETDAKIIERIEAEQAKIRTEITANQKAKESIAKFKSSWIQEGGEELDEKL